MAHQVANQSKAIIASVPEFLSAKLQSQRETASAMIVEQLNYLNDLNENIRVAGFDSQASLERDTAALTASLQRLNRLVETRIDLKSKREKQLMELRSVQQTFLMKQNPDDDDKATSSGVAVPRALTRLSALVVNLIRAGSTADRRSSATAIDKEFTYLIDQLTDREKEYLQGLIDFGVGDKGLFQLRLQELNIIGKIERMEQVYNHDANRLTFSANAISRSAQQDISATSQSLRKELIIRSVILFILAMVCTIGAILLALYISRNISRRLETLEKSMALHAAGGVGEIPHGGNDEITHMAEALRTFIGTINHREKELKNELTEHELTEGKLKSSEERFKDFAETSADWFWEIDEHLYFTYLSGKNLNIFSIEPESGDSTGDKPAHYSDWFEKPEQWHVHYQILQIHLPFENFRIKRTRSDNSAGFMSLTGKPIFDAEGKFKGYRGTGRDVSESHKLSEQLLYQASHDALTGLVNRREFEQRMVQTINASQESDQEHALCYLDLDQFKVVNDTCGHVAGDELLRQLSILLKPKIRKQDTIARLGGDEFGVLLNHCSLPQAQKVSESLRQAISEFRFQWQSRVFKLGVSIGLVPITRDSADFTSVLSNADSACYAAKESGRNRVHLFAPGDEELLATHGQMQWVNRIHQALDEHRFCLYYQSIVPIEEPAIDGEHYELLLRMIDEQGNLVLPGAFLPAAERYNLMGLLDHWVLQHALRWLADSPHQIEKLEFFAINLSAHSLTSIKFLDFVVQEFKKTGIPPAKICFEVTETAAIANIQSAGRFIDQLKALGCRFSLDDFGSGFSSFAYLKNLAIDFIKIDGLFVKDICEDQLDLAMVKSINEIGHVMGKKTMAEFVESDAILNKLRQVGVDYAQGYAISTPLPLPESNTLLATTGKPLNPI